MIVMAIYQIIIFILLVCIECSSRSIVEYCSEMSKETLTKILASALNPRYMSIEEPVNETSVQSIKRSPTGEFYVGDNFQTTLSDHPAWEIDFVEDAKKRNKRSTKKRNKRSIKEKIEIKSEETILSKLRDTRQIFLDHIGPFKSRPWECKAEIVWVDLGYDYFPRYLRTVQCTKKDCWYGHYTCKARSFTVNILRRRNGECARISDNLMGNIDEKTGQFTELWVWDEKPVNFCCDCVVS